jgi:hypothetical protein
MAHGVFLSPMSLKLTNAHPAPPPSSRSSSSPTSSSPTPSPIPDIADHYAILSLDHNATTDEIKARYRSVREVYFATNPQKYRALQAAYAVLVDWEARRQYDVMYRQMRGLPPVGMDGDEDEGVEADGGEVVETGGGLERGCGVGGGGAEVDIVAGDREESSRDDDPNWALKHHRWVYEPVIGTRPYHSFVPLFIKRDKRHACAKPGVPRYTGSMATNSRPC